MAIGGEGGCAEDEGFNADESEAVCLWKLAPIASCGSIRSTDICEDVRAENASGVT